MRQQALHRPSVDQLFFHRAQIQKCTLGNQKDGWNLSGYSSANRTSELKLLS